MTDHHKENRQPASGSAQFLDTELLATLSHELRSPLAIIKGYVTTLLRYDQMIEQNERIDFLRAIDEGSDRLTNSIDRLMDLAMIESGALVLNPVMSSLPYLLRTAISKYGSDRQFNVNYTSCSGLPLTDDILLQVDQTHMLTVFMNIIDNAVKYSTIDSAIDILITPLCTEEEKQHLPATIQADIDISNIITISIRNYGEGILEDNLEQIFGRFQRLEFGLSRDVNGLGLGLTISRYLVELHHGSMWIESQVGVSTTVHILLPINTQHLSKD
ncbi:sensor histidine kinase [Dictyobacter kobayashii]|uniref:histidine kinase n=1 Tax=Dictyobacter kobayashii TaxID=2014872 RepID=A0A402AXL5_9CHLR|nr:ATP-binding protein [Dictyobacter kobayashii]GCE23809.1 hypothetical protein KDK_76090 [Dictyobacter kobayashii]